MPNQYFNRNGSSTHSKILKSSINVFDTKDTMLKKSNVMTYGFRYIVCVV